jgi:serine/threonine protein kinase
MEKYIMPAEVMEKWLKSDRYAQVDGMRLRPLEHSILKGLPLSIQRGQAEAFCLIDENSNGWIVKKFHIGRDLNHNYLISVASLLPKDDGFIAGTKRQILSSATLKKVGDCYHNAKLSAWLNGTILMPKIPGFDWAALADDIREGKIQLQRAQRIEIARNLTSLVLALEKLNLCHRDISSGNTFIDTAFWLVYLIDFDSMYHPSLSMPKGTTCGTVGYAPPFAWQSNALDPRRTWCPCADRYALAVIIVEFLALDKNAPLTAEGGMFDQNELRSRSGKGIERIRRLLQKEWKQVSPLFEDAINSKDFASCPSPKDWQQVLETLPGAQSKPPRLEQLENITPNDFQYILSKIRPAAPLWSTPKLSEMPTVELKLPQTVTVQVLLPDDPWS